MGRLQGKIICGGWFDIKNTFRFGMGVVAFIPFSPYYFSLLFLHIFSPFPPLPTTYSPILSSIFLPAFTLYPFLSSVSSSLLQHFHHPSFCFPFPFTCSSILSISSSLYYLFPYSFLYFLLSRSPILPSLSPFPLPPAPVPPSFPPQYTNHTALTETRFFPSL